MIQVGQVLVANLLHLDPVLAGDECIAAFVLKTKTDTRVLDH